MQKIVMEIVIGFFRTSSARSENILTEIGQKSAIEQTRFFYVTSSTVQKIDRAAQSRFFREVDGAYEYLCRARAVHDVITSTSSLLRRS